MNWEYETVSKKWREMKDADMGFSILINLIKKIFLKKEIFVFSFSFKSISHHNFSPTNDCAPRYFQSYNNHNIGWDFSRHKTIRAETKSVIVGAVKIMEMQAVVWRGGGGANAEITLETKIKLL